jgi:glycosyltransferase involved in cell wall biosynthesis
MNADARRIAVVSPPQSAGSPSAAVLQGLLERGWDAQLLSGAAVSRDLGRIDPQIVHFLGADHARSLLDAVSPLEARTAVSFGAQDNVAGLDVPDYYRPLWERADALHFPDEAVLRRALGRGFPARTPQAVFPPYVDVDAFEPNGRNAGRRGEPGAPPLRVLIAGPLEWTGGCEHGLQALALARAAGTPCDCRVVGDGAHRSALLFARHQLGLADEVTFEDPAPTETLREHMLWADVLLAATVIDGLPANVVEACAMELSVLMSDPGPLGALELDDSVATTVPRRDPRALAEALATLGRDPERRSRMGAAARRWALGHFRLQDHLDRLDDLYRRAL